MQKKKSTRTFGKNQSPDGQKIKNLRIKQDLSQSDLAGRARISLRLLQQIEAGEPCTSRAAARVAQALGAQLNDILMQGANPRHILELHIRGKLRTDLATLAAFERDILAVFEKYEYDRPELYPSFLRDLELSESFLLIICLPEQSALRILVDYEREAQELFSCFETFPLLGVYVLSESEAELLEDIADALPPPTASETVPNPRQVVGQQLRWLVERALANPSRRARARTEGAPVRWRPTVLQIALAAALLAGAFLTGRILFPLPTPSTQIAFPAFKTSPGSAEPTMVTHRSKTKTVRINRSLLAWIDENTSVRPLTDKDNVLRTVAVDWGEVTFNTLLPHDGSEPDLYVNGYGVRFRGTVITVSAARVPCRSRETLQIPCTSNGRLASIDRVRLTVREGRVRFGPAELEPGSNTVKFTSDVNCEKQEPKQDPNHLEFNRKKPCIIDTDITDGPIDIIAFDGNAPVMLPVTTGDVDQPYELRDDVDTLTLLANLPDGGPDAGGADGGYLPDSGPDAGDAGEPAPVLATIKVAGRFAAGRWECTYWLDGKQQFLRTPTASLPAGTALNCTAYCKPVGGGALPPKHINLTWSTDKEMKILCP